MNRASQAASDVSIEAEFQRFRECGDIAALGRVFDATSPRLLALAARASGAAGEAEDLVQATFLKALTHRDQWDEARPLWPWLAGILVHRAQDAGRRRSVRMATPLQPGDGVQGGAADPAELAALDDDLRSVMDAVEKLEEPYRELLALRIERGYDTPDLARQLGRPAATIRVQLSRGRERLEALLPKDLRLSALLLVDSDALLGRLRDKVLASSTGLRIGAHAGAMAVGWTGAKLLFAAAAAVVLLVSAWLVVDRGEGESEPPRRVDPSLVLGEVQATDLAPVGDALEGAVRSEVAGHGGKSGTSASAPALTVRVVHEASAQEESPTPAANVGVYLRLADGHSLGRSGVTAEDGSVEFKDLPPGRYGVRLAPCDKALDDVLVGTQRDVTLVLPAGSHVAGRVVGFDGTPVGGASVYRLDRFHHDAAQWLATTDSHGHFTVADLTGRAELMARAPGHQPSGGKGGRGDAKVYGVAGSKTTVEIQLGARGYLLEGRVLGPDGLPEPYALVVIAVDEDARKEADGVPPRGEITRQNDGDEREPQDTDSYLVRADEHGAFQCEEVPRGTAAILAKSWANPALIGTAVIEIQGAASSHIEVLLSPGAEVYGRIVDESGRPRAGLPVQGGWRGSTTLGQFESGFGEDVFTVQSMTDSNGEYVVRGLLPGETALDLMGANGRSSRRERVDLAPAERKEWNPVVSTHSEVYVRALNAANEPLVGWRVTCASRMDSIREAEALLTDEDGRVRFFGLSDHERVLTLHEPESTRTRSHSIPVAYAQVAASVEEVVLVADPRKSARVVGAVALSAGVWEGNGSARVRLILEDFQGLGEMLLPEDGKLRFEGLPAGDYRLTLSAREAGVPDGLELAAFALTAGESKDLGGLEAAPGVTLVLDFQAPLRSEEKRWGLDLQRAGARVGWSDRPRLRQREPGGPFYSDPLAPGLYVVTFEQRGLGTRRKEIEITSGSSEQHEAWAIADGELTEFVIHFDHHPSGEDFRARCLPTEGRVDLLVSKPDGSDAWLVRVEEPWDADGVHVLTIPCRLEPGNYKVHAEDERYDDWTKPHADAEFQVTEGEVTRVPLRLTDPAR